MDEHRCSKKIWDGGSGRPCYRKGVAKEDGKWWCKQHAPSSVKARRDESDRKFAKEFAERAKREKERLVEYKRMKEWAEHGPKLLEAAKALCRHDDEFDDREGLPPCLERQDLERVIAACEAIGGDDG